MKVFVYYNLRKKVWSVKALSGPNKGRVIAHANVVEVTGATFKVQEAGRQRVLREQRKNVHAGVVGTLGYHGYEKQPMGEGWVGVNYNPYKYSTFVEHLTGSAVLRADRVVLDKVSGVRAYGAS